MKHLFLIFFIFPSLLFGATSGPFITISAPPGSVQPNESNGNSAPLLEVAANGNAFAVWLNFPNKIQAAFFNAGINPPGVNTTPPIGAWTFLGTIAVGSVPTIGVDQNGNAFIAWVSTANGPATQILVRRFEVATMTFSPPLTLAGQQISITGTSNYSPRIAVNGIGVALVIWQQNAPFQIVSSSFSPPPGTGWSFPPTPIFQTPILTNTGPSNIFPSDFALDNLNRGIAIFNTLPQGSIQAARLFVP